jgi:voltage-gated potassium channel
VVRHSQRRLHAHCVECCRVNERSIRIADRFQVPMLIAAALVIPVIITEESHPHGALKTAATVANYVIWLAFAAEAIVMLAVVSDRRTWLREHPIEIVVVLLTPPFLLAATQPIRALRLLRILRLFRLEPLGRRLFSAEGLRYAALLALITALAGGEAFHSVESGQSLGNGVYWAITTMTTVGYGDPEPHTSTGKILAVFVMIIGIGFTVLLTGAIAHRFLAPQLDDIEQASTETEILEEDVLVQVRDITARLHTLEQALASRR